MSGPGGRHAVEVGRQSKQSHPSHSVGLMLCQACHGFSRRRILCEVCRRRVRPAPDRLLSGGVRVIAAFEHSGPARVLAHHLKYRGLEGYAGIVADVLASRIPKAPLVPIPRARSRVIRYGVDPAVVLARCLSERTGAPIHRLLAPSIHTRRRAGGDHRRPVGPLRIVKSPLECVTLVDDVLTTGATLEAAIAVIGPGHIRAAVVANAVPEVSSLRRRDLPVAR